MGNVTKFSFWSLFVLFFFQNGLFALEVGDLETKAAVLLSVEPEDPKCFASGKYDLTCFWDEKGFPEEYTFTYTYHGNDKPLECPVTSHPVEGNMTRYICRPSTVMHFVPLDLHVYRAGRQIYFRNISVNQVVLLDPPANLTMMLTGKPCQLKLSWLPPPLKYMDDSMMYEVSYFTTGSQMGKVESCIFSKHITLRGLQPGIRYEARVRVKLDGLSYDGYWSAWTPTVSMETPPSDTDPLILSLCLIISIIIMLLSVSVLLSRGRFLLKKIWPLIPSPENKFPGLFTLYAGDFQAWLVHSSGGLGWRPEIFYLEELPALLEVLSEASLGPAIPARILPPRALYAAGAEGEDELEEVRKTHADLLDSRKEEPQEPCLLDQLSPLPQDPLSPLERTPLESKDAYVTLNPGPQHDSSQFPLDDVSEESLPLQVLFASPETPGSHSDLGSLRQTSGSGRLSSQSSFESSHSSWHPKSTGYAYLTIADSGIYMDYSPMSLGRTGIAGMGSIYTNEYENEIHPQRVPQTAQHIHSEC
ncbi:hypothetical protein JZ751_005316 [Albula glossodonta]|uniref:Erythropoietin receptor n=1 Tax=Albula glossodonta TaxID=121402 RepID=A0A8T2MPB2_9TELE|nr:hypothetical protein JZ751_005316 [Albula glossodonta]